ncbi:MAG: DUF4382 domain-containing protein [Balneolaceae bacterium]|nr:DUF4382 domain-containing protein [Balneolaceae bacterium]
MKKIKSTISKVITAAMALMVILLAGCSLDSSPQMGSIEVRLHDAPVDFDEVNIFVERVEVNNTEGDEGWQVIGEPNRSFNILELTNGVFEVIGSAELEAGLYPQMRLVVSRDANSVVIDGEEHGLFVPSGAETGVKLNVNAEIQEGIQYTLLLDFDAQRSVRKTGQAQTPGYILQPVIRATNEAISGNIGGMVEPIDARSVVYAIAGSDTLSTTYADTESGEFLLVGLEEGEYTVAFEPREDGYDSKTIEGVSVNVGETTDLETVELQEPSE